MDISMNLTKKAMQTDISSIKRGHRRRLLSEGTSNPHTSAFPSTLLHMQYIQYTLSCFISLCQLLSPQSTSKKNFITLQMPLMQLLRATAATAAQIALGQPRSPRTKGHIAHDIYAHKYRHKVRFINWRPLHHALQATILNILNMSRLQYVSSNGWEVCI